MKIFNPVSEDDILATLRIMHSLLSFSYPSIKSPDIIFFKNYSKTSCPFPYISLQYLNYEMLHDSEESRIRIIQDSLRWIETYGKYSNREELSPSTIEKIWDEAAAAIRMIVFCTAFILTNSQNDKYHLKIAAQDHCKLLYSPETYRKDHNHGFYQNVAILCFCKTFQDNKSMALQTVVEQRILAMCANLFAADGFLKAHSPGYHQLLLKGHIELLNNFTFSDSFKVKLTEAIASMTASLRPFLCPNGLLAQIGDTDATPPFSVCQSAMQSLPPRRHIEILHDSGYAFINISNKKHIDSYIAFIGAFHSREHKHCDDLSFIWNEGMMEILIDSGKYNYKGRFSIGTEEYAQGFWYNATPRIYVESIHAHNCVEINGRSPSRRVTPYGAIPLKGGKVTNDIYFLRGLWKRPDNFHQERLILLRPGEWLFLFDDLSPFIAGAASMLTQWHHFAKEFSVEEQDDSSLQLIHSSQKRRLYCQTLLTHQATSLHRGEILPRLQGWHAADSNTLTPHLAWGIHALSQERQQFATIFSLDKPPHCIVDWSTKDNSLTCFFESERTQERAVFNFSKKS